MPARNVLIVEDDSTVRGFVAELLTDAGYAVLEADTAHQGLSLAQQHEPSVMLIDHGLPDMSGLDLLDRLRTGPRTRHIPVVMVSGASWLARESDRRLHRADRTLSKPFDIDVLLTHVETLATSEAMTEASS
jgi:DNA-binding response OmpR family regulator